MAGFVSFTDPGLMIYPPHRLVDALPDFDEAAFEAALAEWFDVSPSDESVLRDTLAACDAQGKCAIGLAMPGSTRVLVLKNGVNRAEFLGDDHGPAWRDLDVAILHRGLLERILRLPEGVELEYEKDFGKALESVSASRKGFAFLLNPTRADQVRACAEASEAMPQKSTYFFPKLPSGMVLYPF
jgi:uncharacterized protein (DUF1015 family)